MKALMIFVLILSLNNSCGNTKTAGQQKTVQNQSPATVVSKTNDTSQKINKFGQNIIKYGFQFSIPDNWQAEMTDFKSTDLKGQVKTIETDYTDKTTQSRIKLIYHPDKFGMTLYKYYTENTSIKKQKVTIAEQSAIMIDNQLTRDGKGHLLSEPYIRHKIYVLSPNHKGLLEIVYDLPKNNSQAKSIYEHFVQQIKLNRR